MRFVEMINKKKFTLISIFLFTDVVLNLLDGDRGLISFYDKKQTLDKLMKEKKSLLQELDLIEKKNSLLSETINTDYLEIIYREKFMVGKENEKIYVD